MTTYRITPAARARLRAIAGQSARGGADTRALNEELDQRRDDSDAMAGAIPSAGHRRKKARSWYLLTTSIA